MNLDTILAERKNKKIYKDGDKVIKCFDNGYPKADVLNEALNQARVEDINVKIPKLFEVTQIDGHWAIVSEYIAGKTLEQLINEDQNRCEEYLKMFVDLQVKLNSNEVEQLNFLKNKMRKKIASSNLSSDIKFELYTKLEALSKETKLCHGDFNPSNIILQEDGTLCVLDWSHATLGNPCADAARSYLLFCLNGREDCAKKYIRMYAESASVSEKDVQRWIPIVAASQLTKEREHERELLLKWIDVVEY